MLSTTRAISRLVLPACARLSSTAAPAIAEQDVPYLQKRFEGKVALVTGATVGNGVSISRRLGLEGAHVIVNGSNGNVGKLVDELQSEGIDCSGIEGNPAISEQRHSMFNEIESKHGGLDVLVVNIGAETKYANGTKTVLTSKKEDWMPVIFSDLKPAILLVKESLPLMQREGHDHGHIVLVNTNGNVPKEEDSLFNIGAHRIMRGSIFMTTKVAAPKLGESNIRINMISNGFNNSENNEISKPHIKENFWDPATLGRLKRLDSVCGLTAFLASHDSHFLNAEIITVGGGNLLNFG